MSKNVQDEKKANMQTNLLLLLVAIIWGFGFVAQRLGMEHLGPFSYNGIRFILGGTCLLPLALRSQGTRFLPQHRFIHPLLAGLAAGALLFIAATLQQVGLLYTTAGKAGFITGIYVVFVPLIELLLGKRSNTSTWIGVCLAVSGLYLLSINESFSLHKGDALELFGAFFWALHVLALSYLSPRTSPIRLAMVQFYICGLCSLLIGIFFEHISVENIRAASYALLYGGIISVGAGYTLQVVASRKANPTHAAIFLSMESPFAALGGWLFLQETMSLRALSGCALMFMAILISQLWPSRRFNMTDKRSSSLS